MTSLGAQQDDIFRAVAECLTEAGWDIEVDQLTDSWEYSGPPEQLEAYRASRDECSRIATQGISFAPLTDDQMLEIFQYETWTAECLRAEGIEVPEIPSEQVFIERYRSDDPWLAYNYLGQIGESSYRNLLKKCPQL